MKTQRGSKSLGPLWLVWAGVFIFVGSRPAVVLAETRSVASESELQECVEDAEIPGEPSRICRVLSPLSGPFDLSLAADAPQVLEVECVGSGSLFWSSSRFVSGPQDALRFRVHPESRVGWRVILRGCNVSDRGYPGSQTVQGPILVNFGDVPGRFHWDGVTFHTRAFGSSTVGGGVNPISHTELLVENSTVFAPICWDAKSRSPYGFPIVHRFFNNTCVVNDRAEVGSPRALKIEGASHVTSEGNLWAYGQISQSHMGDYGKSVSHSFDNDVFRHRGDFDLPLDAVFVIGSDSDWNVTGSIVSEGSETIPDPFRYWNESEGSFNVSLPVLDAPEPDAAWRSIATMIILFGLAARINDSARIRATDAI